MANALERQISDYQHWREGLVRAIADYRAWLDETDSAEAMTDLRLYDIAEAVRRDHLVIAFVAEFARGKTETINALFFSDFKQRLLPCDAGRTTMCPTEIFYDPAEEPYIKLLPIETRMHDESLALLKQTPGAWSRLRLDMSSADAMKEALNALVERKKVPLETARRLGLWSDDDPAMAASLKSSGMVDVPMWRHALVNFPHPLLESGLVILDTPGLNTLGTEPELTVSIIPNAHAVVFMLATDTGVTRSDMTVWNNFIRGRASRKLALLNKIDMLWDDLKPAAEIQASIQQQIVATSRQLGMPVADVFAISAQKALLAKIRGDEALLERSGIARVEAALGKDLISAKYQIMRDTVIAEISELVKGSRKSMQQRLGEVRAQQQELISLRGKNQGVIQALMANVMADRKLYEESVRSFTQGNVQIKQRGDALLQQLSLQQLDQMLESSRAAIGDSWTTHGLNQGMKTLIKQMSQLAERVTSQSQGIREIGDQLYELFHTRHGFEERKPPKLDLSKLLKRMDALQSSTDEFCKDPVNVMTEKHFLVRKFFYSLVAQARHQFEVAQHDTDIWLKGLLAPLKLQIAHHKAQVEKRTESLMKIHQNTQSLQQSITDTETRLAHLQKQGAALDQILLTLVKAGQPAAQPLSSTASAS